ncbi:hypothetical protein TL16_g11232 [Triparma laevis f. inornata]|uniref:Uncharacterized protein n=1 Tax=Triparma laevis f. inornata TaxID=1714386 RepID=A0A9W7BCX5_9STRA|nr:hypothetical protein TL16_g11232 [Triparma laevis f. inornata]
MSGVTPIITNNETPPPDVNPSVPGAETILRAATTTIPTVPTAPSHIDSSSSDSTPPQPPTPALHLAPSLRLVFHLGGLVSPTLALLGYLLNDERTCWASLNFFFYSWICILTSVTTAPRELRNGWKEPTRICVAFGVECAGMGLAGMVLKESGHRLTRSLGWTGVVFGFLFTLLAPLNNLILVDLINKRFNDEDVNQHVLSQLRTNPGILLTSLYLSSSATKAIIESSPEEATLYQCGNPIIPTFLLNMFIWLTFTLQLLMHFDTSTDHSKITWDQVATMDLPKKIRFELYFYSTLGILALVIFSLIEDSDEATNFDRPLYKLIMTVFIALNMILLFFETYDKVLIQAKIERNVPQPPTPRSAANRKGSHVEVFHQGVSILG